MLMSCIFCTVNTIAEEVYIVCLEKIIGLHFFQESKFKDFSLKIDKFMTEQHNDSCNKSFLFIVHLGNKMGQSGQISLGPDTVRTGCETWIFHVTGLRSWASYLIM